MQIAEVQFAPWDKVYWFDPSGHDLKLQDKVIVHTDLGMELGRVVGLEDKDTAKISVDTIKPIIRKANLSDLEKISTRTTTKTDILKKARELVTKHQLDMKLVDVHFSFDGGRITFAFIADGRIDFRDLVKDLTHEFQKSIRMHQLGVRDEAKCIGECGSCGLELCCKFLCNLGQVFGDYAQTQQVSHRGSERLSGPCGRLKCCLRFEQPIYEEIQSELPEIGRKVQTDHGRGEIISHNIIAGSVNVRLDDKDKTVVKIPILYKKEKKDKD